MTDRVDVCHALRRLDYVPYAPARTGFRNLECISYSYPTDDGQFQVLARQPGQPTTVAAYDIPPIAVDLAKLDLEGDP